MTTFHHNTSNLEDVLRKKMPWPTHIRSCGRPLGTFRPEVSQNEEKSAASGEPVKKSLRELVEGINTRLDVLEADMGTRKADMEARKVDMEALEARVAALEEVVNAHSIDINALKQESARQQDTLDPIFEAYIGEVICTLTATSGTSFANGRTDRHQCDKARE